MSITPETRERLHAHVRTLEGNHLTELADDIRALLDMAGRVEGLDWFVEVEQLCSEECYASHLSDGARGELIGSYWAALEETK